MLKLPVLHPEILSSLAQAGHLAKVLISDGNYPHSTKPFPRARVLHANYTPGVLDALTVLKLVASLVPIETIELMEPERTGAYAMVEDPPIWAKFRRLLREEFAYEGPFKALTKPEFNQAARSEDLCLVIATAETQIFANVLLTIGVVR